MLLLTENEYEYDLNLDEVSKMVDTTFSRLFYTNKPKIQLLDKYLKSLEYIKNFINTTEINKNNLEEGYFSFGYDNDSEQNIEFLSNNRNSNLLLPNLKNNVFKDIITTMNDICYKINKYNGQNKRREKKMKKKNKKNISNDTKEENPINPINDTISKLASTCSDIKKFFGPSKFSYSLASTDENVLTILLKKTKQSILNYFRVHLNDNDFIIPTNPKKTNSKTRKTKSKTRKKRLESSSQSSFQLNNGTNDLNRNTTGSKNKTRKDKK